MLSWPVDLDGLGIHVAADQISLPPTDPIATLLKLAQHLPSSQGKR
jgi:hypothetical protein